MADDDNFRNWNVAYKHFEKYCGGSCTFDDLTVILPGFLTYMLSLTTHNRTKMMASTANNNLNKLKMRVATGIRGKAHQGQHRPTAETRQGSQHKA